jgi:hypothetical protein
MENRIAKKFRNQTLFIINLLQMTLKNSRNREAIRQKYKTKWPLLIINLILQRGHIILFNFVFNTQCVIPYFNVYKPISSEFSDKIVILPSAM